MFNWISFLESYGIQYVTKGYNVSRGHIGIECPFCNGQGRPFHLAISLSGKGWHCWRDSDFRGRRPQRLIIALIGCSYADADRIADSQQTRVIVSDDTFADVMLKGLGMNNKIEEFTNAKQYTLDFMDEFVHPLHTSFCGRICSEYLVNERHYKYNELEDLYKKFKLLLGLRGPFSYRIVIPIYHDGYLVNWTGRTIVKNEELRYKTLSSDPKKAREENLPCALMNIKDCLFDIDRLVIGGNTLVICEGPFDAMRITWLGEKKGILGTCLFNKTLSDYQRWLLESLRNKFEHCVSLFDSDAGFEDFTAFPEYMNVRKGILPLGIKDPADLTEGDFTKMF